MLSLFHVFLLKKERGREGKKEGRREGGGREGGEREEGEGRLMKPFGLVNYNLEELYQNSCITGLGSRQ